MRKHLLIGCSTLLLAVFALGSTRANACDDDCGCGYRYDSYNARPAYTYYYGPAVYYAPPVYYSRQVPTYYFPYYARHSSYAPRAHYVSRHVGHRRW